MSTNINKHDQNRLNDADITIKFNYYSYAMHKYEIGVNLETKKWKSMTQLKSYHDNTIAVPYYEYSWDYSAASGFTGVDDGEKIEDSIAKDKASVKDEYKPILPDIYSSLDSTMSHEYTYRRNNDSVKFSHAIRATDNMFADFTIDLMIDG